jgi:magnesium transporter
MNGEEAQPEVASAGDALRTVAPAAPSTVHLFDAQGDDTVVDIGEVGELGDNQLLWIDLVAPAEEEVVALLDRLGARRDAQPYLLHPTGRPRADDYGEILHLEVTALADADTAEPISIICLVGNGWLVTAHRQPVQFLKDFRERAAGGSELGALDAPSFLARLLEWQLTTYNAAVEAIVEAIDDLDQALLADKRDEDTLLPELVALRRRIARLRMRLAPHRDVFARLASPELDRVSSSQSAEAFRSLSSQVARVVETVEDTREMLLGSFDILMTRTGQRTNDVMKVLTIASVALLPSTLIAGILGMNFHPAFFNTAGLFWVALAVMATLLVLTLVGARRMRWI